MPRVAATLAMPGLWGLFWPAAGRVGIAMDGPHSKESEEARGHPGVLQQILGVLGILSQILASYRHMHQDAQDLAGIHCGFHPLFSTPPHQHSTTLELRSAF